jgi:hypothetical protein
MPGSAFAEWFRDYRPDRFARTEPPAMRVVSGRS